MAPRKRFFASLGGDKAKVKRFRMSSHTNNGDKTAMAMTMMMMAGVATVGSFACVGLYRKTEMNDFTLLDRSFSRRFDDQDGLGNDRTSEENKKGRIRLLHRRTNEGVDVSTLIGDKISLDELSSRYHLIGSKPDFVKGLTSVFAHQHDIQRSIVGTGAYGQVIKAQDNAGRKVAVKIVGRSAMSWHDLKDEVEALKVSRKHPNVAELIEVLYCPDTDSFYIVTEYCAGGELFDRLIDNGPYKEPEAAYLVERIASALQHIHSVGYAHCDIKPENLLFASKDDDTEIRLIDFGMTKSLKYFLTEGFTPVTSSLGTTPYLPVEVLKELKKDSSSAAASNSGNSKQKNYDGKVNVRLKSDPRALDIWGLGCVMYIMLLGCHPFDRTGDAKDEVIAARAMRGSLKDEGDDDLDPIDRRFTFEVHKRLILSEEAKDLMTKLLDPNPKTRITSDQINQHPWIVKFRKIREKANENPQESMSCKKNHPKIDLKSFKDATSEHRVVSSALLLAALARRGKKANTERADYLAAAHEKVIRWIDDESKKQELPLETFKAIVSSCHAKKFQYNEPVFQEGDEANGVFFITKGKATLEYKGENGTSRVVSNLSPGDMFGETAILDGRDKRNATVRCNSRDGLEVVFWEREDFVNSLGNPESALSSGIEEHIRARQNLRAARLLHQLGEDVLSLQTFKKGEVIFRQDEGSNYLYLIEEGNVETCTSLRAKEAPKKVDTLRRILSNLAKKAGRKRTLDENQIPLRKYSDGEIFGTETLSDMPRLVSATCTSDTLKVWRVSGRNLKSLLGSESSLHRNLLRLSRRESEEKLARLRKAAVTGAMEGDHLGSDSLDEIIKAIEKTLKPKGEI